MTFQYRILYLILLCCLISCNEESKKQPENQVDNLIRHAQGLAIFEYDGYSVVKVTNPWPESKGNYTYVLKQKNGKIPDSLTKFPTISVPVKDVIVTSTTHIPSLEMLGVENTLRGFPNLSYISSDKVRQRIDEGHIREVGNNQSLNTEVVIDISPDVIVGYGIDNNNPALDNLQKSGLKVMLNGDWNEQSPLGKAEWIKFFGALYGLEAKADKIFNDIETDYNRSLALVSNIAKRPTVMAGAIFQNQWYTPQGESWGAVLIKQAGGNYLWADSKGTGSLSLPFEKVFEKAQDADVWIGPAQFTSLQELKDGSAHYSQFAAFRNKSVYSFSTKKGKTGGVIYYELAPNRPDLVLKDMVKILHPELLPEHELFFFEKLK